MFRKHVGTIPSERCPIRTVRFVSLGFSSLKPNRIVHLILSALSANDDIVSANVPIFCFDAFLRLDSTESKILAKLKTHRIKRGRV